MPLASIRAEIAKRGETLETSPRVSLEAVISGVNHESNKVRCLQLMHLQLAHRPHRSPQLTASSGLLLVQAIS